MSIIKVLNIKYLRENTRASFSDYPALLLVILTERFICLACEICLSKTNISYISDRVERIVESTSNSSELNDSEDQAADSQQQEAEETIPESSTSRYGRKRTRVLREKLCAMA